MFFSASYLVFLAAVFGAVVGSFLNVLVLRMRTGRGFCGRSACMACGKTLSAGELVPIISFLLLRGRCRACKSAISIQSILVETATAISFALIAWKTVYCATALLRYCADLTPFLFLFFAFAVAATLIAIAAYDIKHKIIPDGFVAVLAVLAIVRLVFLWPDADKLASQLFSAFGIFLFFLILWAVSKGKWIGFGDVKLSLPLALILPWSDNLAAVILSFWSGALIGLALIAWGRMKTRKAKYHLKSEIPFAPFLILGTAIAYFIQVSLFPF